MSQKFSESKTSGKHAELARLVGNWEGTSSVWLNPDGDPETAPQKGSMRLIMDGRFILHEYSGSFQGKPLEGLAIYGYHLGLKKYQAFWIDSFHTGTDMLFSESKKGEDSFNVLGSYAYVTPESETHWGWRTEIEVVNDDEIRITAFNVMPPDNQEEKATETIYRRLKS